MNELRILYVGRKNRVAADLQTLFEQPNPTAAASESAPITFTVMTNQKSALHLIGTQPPATLWVEMEQRSASRLRFCETVRYRLPSVAILAVGNQLPVMGEFKFDGLIKLPLATRAIWQTVGQLQAQRNEHKLYCGPITLDLATRTVMTPNGRYPMTPKQCALLKLFMNQHGEVIKRRHLMEQVWDTSYVEDTRTLDVHIRWLRECIEPNPSKPSYLKTVRGIGYCFKITQ
ncbi:MAG: winged helix-turn-helix transcriptional regulator [Caldilineaceae bacterium]|nr:winged helix-turn-helix transcriptional regulator [Caldilineaceae bacterium]